MASDGLSNDGGLLRFPGCSGVLGCVGFLFDSDAVHALKGSDVRKLGCADACMFCSVARMYADAQILACSVAWSSHRRCDTGCGSSLRKSDAWQVGYSGPRLGPRILGFNCRTFSSSDATMLCSDARSSGACGQLGCGMRYAVRNAPRGGILYPEACPLRSKAPFFKGTTEVVGP